MNNSRRRREVLILGVLLGNAIGVTNLPQYESYKKMGPFVMLAPLDDLFKKVLPAERDREKELIAAKMVVNAILPSDYFRSSDEQKLWFAAQFAYELIQSGWRVPTGEIESMFVQGIFDVSQQMAGRITLPDHWEEKPKRGVEHARASGYYVK